MSMSESARFARVEALLDAALEKPEGEREAFLHLQESDAVIRTEVLELLRAVEQRLQVTIPERYWGSSKQMRTLGEIINVVSRLR